MVVFYKKRELKPMKTFVIIRIMQ